MLRRDRITGRVCTLADASEPPPPPATPAERLALMKQLCEELWALAGWDLDHGPRSTWSGRVLRKGDSRDP